MQNAYINVVHLDKERKNYYFAINHSVDVMYQYTSVDQQSCVFVKLKFINGTVCIVMKNLIYFPFLRFCINVNYSTIKTCILLYVVLL